MAPRTHLNSWRTGLRSSAWFTLAAWPLRWIGCPPTPRGWIKLRSGLVSCNANSCTRTIFSALTSWSRPSSISLPTTTRRPSRSTGLILSRNLKRNSERIHDSLYLANFSTQLKCYWSDKIITRQDLSLQLDAYAVFPASLYHCCKPQVSGCLCRADCDRAVRNPYHTPQQ